LDQVIDAAAYKGFNRCPVLVCPDVQVDGAKSTYYKFCANPSKFHSNGRHFCGVHKFTFRNHPDALKEGRIFDCETDVVVCSRLYGMGLAYSLNEAHVRAVRPMRLAVRRKEKKKGLAVRGSRCNAFIMQNQVRTPAGQRHNAVDRSTNTNCHALECPFGHSRSTPRVIYH
jgi:hypothetical protein